MSAIENCFMKMSKLFKKQATTLNRFFIHYKRLTHSASTLFSQKKSTFLSYSQKEVSVIKKSSLTKRYIIQGQKNQLEKLKKELLDSPTQEDAQEAINNLVPLQDWDGIWLTLKKKKAPAAIYLYAAQKALHSYGYKAALRIVKEVLRPNIYKTILEYLVRQNKIEMVPIAIEQIGCYILHYHRLSPLDAKIYMQYAYVYAALEAARHKRYEIAYQWATKTGKNFFVWVELTSIVCQNQNYCEVERFAEEAGHLMQEAYACAFTLCPKDLPWHSVFSQKSGRALATI